MEFGGDLLADDVFGQADDDRAGPSAHRREQGFRDDFGSACGVVQDHHALGAGIEPGFDVEFLEGLAVPMGEGDQPNEQHHGGGVLPRGVQADVGIGGAGTTGNHRDAGQLVHLPVSLCHVRGSTLVAAHDGLDGRVVEPVKNVKEALARHHMGPLDAVGGKRINDDVASGLAGCLQQVPWQFVLRGCYLSHG